MRALYLSLGAFGPAMAGGVLRYHLQEAEWMARLGRPCLLGPGLAGQPAGPWMERGARIRGPYVNNERIHPRLRDLCNRTLQGLRPPPAGCIFQATWHGGADLRLRHRGPFCLMIHDFIPELLSEGRILGHLHNPHVLENRRRLVGRADAIFVNSESTRRDLLERHPEVRGKVHVTLLGCDLPAVPAASEVEASAGVPHLLWVGRRAAYKNFSRTLLAFSRLAVQELRLLCVGGGAFDADECALVSKLGLSGRVSCREANDEQLSALYHSALGLAYTSQYEGFGLPVLEALHQGCPVLCSGTSSLPEVGGPQALYCDPNDDGSLLAGLHQLLGQDRSAEARAARRSHAASFTWERCFRLTDEVFRRLDQATF